MIVVGILGIFESIVSAVLGALPSPSVPGLNSLAESMVSGSWFDRLGWVNDYLPLTAMLSAGAVVFLVWGGSLAVKLVIFVLTKVHVLGGNG